MLERVSLSGIPLLMACCWLSAAPAGGRTAGLSVSPVATDSTFRDSSRVDTIAAGSSPLDSVAPAAAIPVPPHRADARGPFPGASLLLQAPFFDFPYGLDAGPTSPSMRQSLLWNVGAVQLADQSIGWLWEGMRPGVWRALGLYGSLGLFNYLSVYLPPGQGWMHEEWHRAVMTRYGISSYDGIYHWNIGAEAVSVDHVKDADLADLKARHPADFTRLMEAGIEGETESVRLMRRQNFFLGRQSDYDAVDWWSSAVNGTAYIYICSIKDYDKDLEKADRAETIESQRDFTGLDFRAWVYDMRHPDEAYGAGPRGRTHVTGSGFDRYLLYPDLTAGERDYLRLQAGLSLLNLVSPQMFGSDWLPGTVPWDGAGILWNFGLVHHLTPFGYEVGGDLLVRRGKWSWAFSAQGLVNGAMALPGIGGELYRYPLEAGRTHVFLTGGVSAWLQPQDQLYRTTSVQPGAAARVGAALPLWSAVEVFAEADAKTAGWVAGNVYLDAAAQGRAGLQLRL